MNAFCKYVFLLAILATPFAGTLAQSFPNKPIRLLIGFAPGGGTDVASRGLTHQLTDKFGQPIVIDYGPVPAARWAMRSRPRSRLTDILS